MREQRPPEQLTRMKGTPVRTSRGEHIGSIDEVYFGAGREPEWINLTPAGLERDAVVVPVRAARIYQDEVRVPFSKKMIRDAPSVERSGGGISMESRRDLSAYFGMAAPDTTSSLFRYTNTSTTGSGGLRSAPSTFGMQAKRTPQKG